MKFDVQRYERDTTADKEDFQNILLHTIPEGAGKCIRGGAQKQPLRRGTFSQLTPDEPYRIDCIVSSVAGSSGREKAFR